MKEVAELENGHLNVAIRGLNDMCDAAGNKLLEKNLRYIGVTKEDRVKTFVEAYEAFANRTDAEELEFPEHVVNFYTMLFKDELEGGEEEEAAEAEAEYEEEAEEAEAEEADDEIDEEDEEEEEPEEAEPEPEIKKPRKSSRKSEMKEYIIKLIDQGKWTRKQVLDKAVAKFPKKAKSTARTYITDALSEKYGVKIFGKRAKVNEKGIISWS